MSIKEYRNGIMLCTTAINQAKEACLTLFDQARNPKVKFQLQHCGGIIICNTIELRESLRQYERDDVYVRNLA